ncbi:MAG: hypothetical protein K8I29_15200 [Alphaproteobacteria bacterium]|uniref:PilZ domain-containing protein n=1 Tax=Candidatus Nitrobium versatile TaxID=2884831 RepID=A0A953JDD7_9BACT|nr:hypothetical protein [Candidatus Nitrobium versatile]
MDTPLKSADQPSKAVLSDRVENGRRISRKQLVNILNYISFQDGTLLVRFEHVRYGTLLSLPAKPRPCSGDKVDCLWSGRALFPRILSSHRLHHILISDGQKLILIQPDMDRADEKGIRFLLPEVCYELNMRKTRRHSCEGIRVEFVQSGMFLVGELQDFSAVSFRIEIPAGSSKLFGLIDPEATATLVFRGGQEVLYSGECRIIRRTHCRKTGTLVLEPVHHQIRRFKPKEFRSSRQILSPAPNCVFRHPLTGKTISLPVVNLSGSGFLVEEHFESSVLLPGLIIPHLEMTFAPTFHLSCRAQVIYRNVDKTPEGDVSVKCGIAILDMDIQEQAALSAFLHHSMNLKSHVCNKVDLDDLWHFFFEAGFVYPKKYALMHAEKEKFRETYKKLYMQNPHIARHFIYQDKGVIQGHIAMVRFYENTWLIHHHAASKSNAMVGLSVLNQVGRYINDFHSLQSTHMDFVACYFRPDNKFPRRVFGGCAAAIKDPKGCSVDTFAYFHFSKSPAPWSMPEGIHCIAETDSEDLLELESFYEHTSGGLMLQALDLEPQRSTGISLNREYNKLGFKRARYLFTLKRGNSVAAVIMVIISDVGLNLSNLTNCVHVFIPDTDNLPPVTLHSVLSMLSGYYNQEDIPVLLYPASYVEKHSMPYEKLYSLWVLNMQHTDHYFRFIESLVGKSHG